MPEQTLASSKSFNDDSIQKMFFTQALQPASTSVAVRRRKYLARFRFVR
jgi:hypothetical protein